MVIYEGLEKHVSYPISQYMLNLHHPKVQLYSIGILTHLQLQYHSYIQAVAIANSTDSHTLCDQLTSRNDQVTFYWSPYDQQN